MALKLDMSKAYDKVEWPFLKGMMTKLVFVGLFIDFILHCINSVQYSVLLNGDEGSSFKPSRGLHQGDLLSPYLFLFCREGLSALMRLASQERKIFGAKDKNLTFQVLNVRCSTDPEKYLGLPNMSLWAVKGLLLKGLGWRIGDERWVLPLAEDVKIERKRGSTCLESVL
ncbi:hypothetical protein PVK06_039190 [Gossypium arboreum]|uniref:Reverse transcriptase domain-containing protein n=1 Tax=Gossypium arboreum TaxID=29729 RepID=A0ABR0N4Z3_GOSAR|nr:hypothetical protein PVK06_039190 [Gossypium arboreum]